MSFSRSLEFILGIRVSLYNAVTEEQVDRLVKYIGEFFTQSGAA